MIALASRDGYQSVSIAQLSAQAGVSSATFYQQFDDKEDCLLAAYRQLNGHTFDRMRRVLGESDWVSATRDAFVELLSSVHRDPAGARVQFIESMAGGPRVQAEIASALDEVESGAELLLDNLPSEGTTLDVPAGVLVGGVRSLVARHLRTRSEDRLPAMTGDVLAWMASYAVPVAQGRWSVGPRATLDPATIPTSIAANAIQLAIEPLPRGRHGLSPSVVARSQRTRIIFAVAQVTMEKGYADTTVADIVSTAGVAKEAFYKHFADKQHAFLEAQQHFTQDILDLCVASYFTPDEWPERLWAGLITLLGLIAANQAIAHLRLVECYAAGPEAIRRAEEITRSFTIFLEEGYRQRPEARALPRLYSQAIAGAVFEIIQREVAAGRSADAPRLLPQITYICLAPFIGPDEAIRCVDEMSAGFVVGSAASTVSDGF